MKEIAPKVSVHREEKEVIEKFLKSVSSPIFVKETAVSFFGLYTKNKDGAWAECPEIISEEEVQLFRIFFLHVMKRVISAHSHKYDGAIEHGIEDTSKILDLSNLSEEKKSSLFNTLLHDLSHSVGQIAKNDRDGLSAVQPFLRYPVGSEYNKKEILEDELRAFIFGSFYHPNPLGVRSKMHLETSFTFDDYRRNFLRKSMNGALRDNENLIEIIHPPNAIVSFEKIESLTKEAQNIGNEIIAKPPLDVEIALRYIWDHRDNPRVLVDLFFKEVGPYIEKLQERREYSVKIEN